MNYFLALLTVFFLGICQPISAQPNNTIYSLLSSCMQLFTSPISPNTENATTRIPDTEINRWENLSNGVVSNIDDLKIWIQSIHEGLENADEICHQASKLKTKSQSTVLTVSENNQARANTGFGDFYRRGEMYRYEDMPDKAKRTNFLLYRGHGGVKTVAEAEAKIQQVFQIGLAKYGGTHRDVSAHKLDWSDIDYEDDEKWHGNSEFLGTTAWFPIAASHGLRKFNVKPNDYENGKELPTGFEFTNFGVVFVIDPLEGQILNTRHLPFRIVRSNEGEVLFSREILPQNIVGAILVDRSEKPLNLYLKR